VKLLLGCGSDTKEEGYCYCKYGGDKEKKSEIMVGPPEDSCVGWCKDSCGSYSDCSWVKK